LQADALGSCPDTAVNADLVIDGPGIADYHVPTAQVTGIHEGHITAQFGTTLKAVADANNATLTSNSEYMVTIRCLDSTGAVLGTYTGGFHFDPRFATMYFDDSASMESSPTPSFTPIPTLEPTPESTVAPTPSLALTLTPTPGARVPPGFLRRLLMWLFGYLSWR
jgi:hypothetical protein